MRRDYEERLLRGQVFTCGGCDQRVELYGRLLNVISARSLEMMAGLWDEEVYMRLSERWWIRRGRFSVTAPRIHIPTMMQKAPGILGLGPEYENLSNVGGDRTISHHWGLIRPVLGMRRTRINPGEGKFSASGWWEQTYLSNQWLWDEVKLPKCALVYNQRLYGLVGPLITFEDALIERRSLASQSELRDWGVNEGGE